ncbi:MAG: S8 family peptidase [Pseudomonadota bacterium]
MPSETPRPLLNPVLKFTKDPRPERVSGGGKNVGSIQASRLVAQRVKLQSELRNLSAAAKDRPQFNGRVLLYVAMFEDSLATSYTPKDLFCADRGARLLAPFRSGYLVEAKSADLKTLAAAAADAQRVADKVDISRVKSVRFFESDDAMGLRDIDQIWADAPKVTGGRAFLAWLMPLHDDEAGEELLDRLETLRDGVIAPAPPLLGEMAQNPATLPVGMQRSVRLAAGQDRLNVALRAYRQTRRAVTTLIAPSKTALVQLAASGTVFRLEPVQPISSTAPGDGNEPMRPLPRSMSLLPVVGVVDGGLTARSYKPAEVWSAPPFVPNAEADSQHGNRVTSLIVQGHDWNNNLSLPSLYCRVGTVQAVPKRGSRSLLDPQGLLAYLDLVMAANPDTKVWNFSFNQPGSCDPEAVSYLGHGLASLARKHKVLPIISVGNKPGDLIKPPADCEAAITIGGRAHDINGGPAGPCAVSLNGPGPSSMLKPELSHFSNVRVLGGLVTSGSSFAAALTSPLAAHAMHRLREPTPDLVKGLLLHRAEGAGYDAAIGFGSPGETLPWECPLGVVTMQWTASLRPGAAYYWELPIPPSLRKGGKLRGHGKLTAVLNPHPLATEFGGPNYFGARVETALQGRRAGKAFNLLGALDTGRLTEEQARSQDHKWSPVRQHARTFKGVAFDGDALRIYARTFTRDLYLHGYNTAEEVPALEVVFVLTLGTGDPNDDVYDELRVLLGSYVENAVLDADIDIETDI